MSYELEGLEELRKNLKPEIFDSVMTTTGNEIASGAFSKARTEVKRKWNLDIKPLNNESNRREGWAFVHKTSPVDRKRTGHFWMRRATLRDGIITIFVSGDPIPVSLFEYSLLTETKSKRTFKQKRAVAKRKQRMTAEEIRRVRIKILKKGSPLVLGKAFVAKMKSGHVGIFERSGKSSLPILEKAVISAPSMFDQVDLQKLLDEQYNKSFVKRFSHNLERKTKGYWR